MIKSGMNILFVTSILVLLLLCGGCTSGNDNKNFLEDTLENNETNGFNETLHDPLQITYYGHSTFLVEGDISILMDPYDPGFGYGLLKLDADVVTISHDHSDHNFATAGGSAEILKGFHSWDDWQKINRTISNTKIYTVNTYHDNQSGERLGKNSIFVIETAEMRIVHLGDLGHPLDEEAVEAIGEVDILLFPAGGYYTISFSDIISVLDVLKPKIGIPMHYRTPQNEKSPIDSLYEFLKKNILYNVVETGVTTLEFSKESLPSQTEIWTMSYVAP